MLIDWLILCKHIRADSEHIYMFLKGVEVCRRLEYTHPIGFPHGGEIPTQKRTMAAGLHVIDITKADEMADTLISFYRRMEFAPLFYFSYDVNTRKPDSCAMIRIKSD